VSATGGWDYGEFPTSIGRIEIFDAANCFGSRSSMAGRITAMILSSERIPNWPDVRMMQLDVRKSSGLQKKVQTCHSSIMELYGMLETPWRSCVMEYRWSTNGPAFSCPWIHPLYAGLQSASCSEANT
jgi:hypothetical protein